MSPTSRLLFFRHPEDVLEAIQETFGPALGPDNAGLAALDRPHRKQMRHWMKGTSADERRARKRRFLVTGATRTAKRLARRGALTQERFQKEVQPLLEKARARGAGGLAMVSEIGASTWRREGPEAALVMEELWHQMATDVGFAMTCVYPMEVFEAKEAGRLKALHGQILEQAPDPAA